MTNEHKKKELWVEHVVQSTKSSPFAILQHDTHTPVL